MTELVYSHKLKYVPDIQGLIIGFLFIYISTGISHHKRLPSYLTSCNTLIFPATVSLSTQNSVCTQITIDHRNFPTWQISWRATGGGRGQSMSVSLRPPNDPSSLSLYYTKKWAKFLWYMFGHDTMNKTSTRTLGTINARADILSWLCGDERWWPCACMDDNSLKGTKVNVFTFTVQHNNRCYMCPNANKCI